MEVVGSVLSLYIPTSIIPILRLGLGYEVCEFAGLLEWTTGVNYWSGLLEPVV